MFVARYDTIIDKNVQVCSTAGLVLVSSAGETSITCSTDQNPYCRACSTGSPGDVYLDPANNSCNSAAESNRVEENTLTIQIHACSECNFVCFQQNLSHNIRSFRVGNGHLDDINIASNKQKNHTLQIATILLHHM